MAKHNSISEKSASIKVFIVEEDEAFLKKLVRTLEKEQDITIAGTCDNPETAGDILSGSGVEPDILLLSFSMQKPVSGNMAWFGDVRAGMPKTRIIILGERHDQDEIFVFIKEGIRGFLLKEEALSCIAKSIRVVSGGEIWLDSSLVSRVFDAFSDAAGSRKPKTEPPSSPGLAKINQISKREWEVLRLLSKGCKNEEIAKSLFISVKTVKTHMKNIFRKMGCTCRLEAALLFIEHSGSTACKSSNSV